MKKNIKSMKKTIIPIIASLLMVGIVWAANTFPSSLNNWSTGDTITADWANSLEAKIGADNSNVTTSLDYLVKTHSQPAQLTVSGTSTLSTTTISGSLTVSGAGSFSDYLTLSKDPTEFSHAATKEYVDLAVTSLGAAYYMYDEDDATGYKTCYLNPSTSSEASTTNADLADNDYIGGWISAEGEAPAKLLKGVYDWYITMKKTDGTKTLRVYWVLVERKSDTSEVNIATSSYSNTINGRATYMVPLQLEEDHILGTGSRIVGKLYADVSGNGSAPDLKIYYQGDTSSRWEIPASSEIFRNIFVPYTDAVKSVDLGSKNVTTTGTIKAGSAVIGNLTGFLKATSGVVSTSTIDISDDTNLSVSGTLLDLTDDTLSVNEGTLTDGKGCKYVSGTGLVCDQSYLTTVDISDDTNLTAGRSLTLSGDSIEADAELYTFSFSFNYRNATTTDDAHPGQCIIAPTDLTITKVGCSQDNSTSSIQLEERALTSPYSAGTDILSSNLTCGTTYASTTSFSNSSITSGNRICLAVDVQNGVSTTTLIVDVSGTKND